jgi:glycosyltransferase involved in cell wall biosynthesis
MRIVGIFLGRNEERFAGRVIRNAGDFCDEMLLVDHASEDGTGEILRGLAAESGGKWRYHSVAHPRESHDLIAGYAGSETWIFAVDGDEVYDPAGLGRMRGRLMAGEFARDWCVFGNVLNVRELDGKAGVARGHLSPPCRSMTKLYNFAAIEAWDGPCLERLHGGTVRFRAEFLEHSPGERARRELQHSVSWEEADFRCLHLCFVERSRVDAANRSARKNIMDLYNWSWTRRVRELWRVIKGEREVDSKEQRYGRGPLVEKPWAPFFPGGLP